MSKRTPECRAEEIAKVLELFRQYEHGLIRGAFIRVTSRKVAWWLAGNRLRLIYSQGELVGAVVLARVAARQWIRDFSGVIRTQLEVGDLFAKRIACRSGCER